MAIRIVTQNKTVTTAISWESTARLSAGGTFSFSMPATSSETAYIEVLQRVDCYWDATLVGSGYVKDMDFSGDTLNVRGDDMAFELTATMISHDETGTVDAVDAIDWIGDELPVGWTLDNQVTGSATVYLSAVVHESLLATLGAICTAASLWFVIDGTTLTVSDSYGAIRHGVEITEISKRVDSNEIVNKVFSYGGGDRDAAITLQPSTLTVSGYSINKSANSITFTGSAYPVREREVQFGKIAPRVVTESALVEASNALVSASIEYLKQHATPIESYSVTCFYPDVILPLERVALAVKTDSLLVNETPVVIESRISITTQGAVTTRLTLEKDARKIPTDASVVASAIVQAHNAAIYPVPKNENSSSSARKLVHKSDNELELSFALNTRTIQIKRALLSGTLTDTGMRPGMSADGLEYRMNGTGSWVTLTGSVNLLTALTEADTGYPVMASGVVNVRAIDDTPELIRLIGESSGSVPALPAGTKILLLEDTTVYTAGAIESSLVVKGTFIAGTVINVQSATWVNISTYATNKDAKFIAVDWATSPFFAYLRVYVIDNLTSTMTTGSVNGRTSAFEAHADIALSIQSVTV